MKLLTQSYRNFKHTNNWVWMTDGPENGIEGENNRNSLIDDDIKRESLDNEQKKEKILVLLESPLQFSYLDIKFIEDNLELVERERKFRIGFQKIAEYFLSLSVVDSTIMPPRILYQLSGSKLSRQFLPVKLKRSIDMVIDNHTSKLIEICEQDISLWSIGKTAKLLSLYKYLKKKNKNGKELRPAFKQISEKLIKKVIDITQVAQDQKRKLNTSERLILWEIKRQMPEQFRASADVQDVLGDFSNNEGKALLQDILNQNKKNNPELVLLWDVLEDLAYSHEVQVNDDEKKKLRNFVLRGNTAQLLDALKNTNPKVLLPSHLSVLSELRNPEGDFKKLWKNTNEEFEEELTITWTKEDLAKQKKYKDQIRELEKNKEEIEVTELQDLIASGRVTTEEENKYKSRESDLSKFLHTETFNGKSIDDIVSDISTIINTTGRDPLKNMLEDILTDLAPNSGISDKERVTIFSSLIEKLRTLKASGFNHELKEAQEKNENIQERILKAIQNSNGETPKEIGEETSNTNIVLLDQAEIAKLRKVLKIVKEKNIVRDLQRKNEKFIQARKDVRNSVQQNDNDKLSAINKKLETLRTQNNNTQIEQSKTESIFQIYSDPNSFVDDIQNNYDKSLELRIKNHKLHAADFQVIMGQGFSSDTDTQQIHTFRNKFEALLDEVEIDMSQIDLSQIDIENLESQSNLDAIQPWIDALEEKIGIDKFRNLLKSELNEFVNPQIKSEILKGAMGHFHEKIEAKIEDALNTMPNSSEDYLVQKNFFLNQIRAHNNVYSPASLQKIEESYRQYFDEKYDLDTKVSVERNKLEGTLEGLDSADKQRVREAYEHGVSFLEDGYSIEEFQYPGTKKINEASLQSASVTQALHQFSDQYTTKIENLSKTLLNPKQDLTDITQQYKDLKESWKKEGKYEIKAKIKSFKNLCRDEIFIETDENGNKVYQAFLDNYFKSIDMAYDLINEGFDEMASVGIASLTGREQVFPYIQNGFDKLQGWMNFRDGEFGKLKKYIEGRLFEHKRKDKHGNTTDKNENGFSETVQHLKDYGVFDNQEEASKKFQKIRVNFNTNLNSYESHVKKVDNLITSDINALSDEKFESKYGMHKAEAQNIINRNGEFLKDFKGNWATFNDPKYFEKWYAKYKESAESRFDAIREFQDFERLSDNITEMNGSIEGIEKWLGGWNEYGEKEKSNRWYNRIGLQPISLYSIFQLIQKNIEIVDTRWKRKQDQMAYNIGMQVFGDSAWGKEFRRLGEESEEARVKEWETTYEELDPWDLAEHLYKTKDPDEAKAAINLLIPQAYIQWTNPQLWRTLMRLQNSITFFNPEDMSLDPEALKQKIKDACSIIWSKKVFDEWNGKIDEGINSEKSKWSKDYTDLGAKMEDNETSTRVHLLAEMLRKWKAGEIENIQPGKFIAFLHLAFEQAEMNGHPDPRWYLLIKGVSTLNPQGQPFISSTIFNKFNNDLKATVPHLDFFMDTSSWKKNGRIVPPNTPGAEQREWKYHDFLAWGNMLGDSNGTFNPQKEPGKRMSNDFFMEVINQSNDAKGRVHRYFNNAGKNFDRDDFAMAGVTYTADEVLRLLSSRSEGTEQTDRDSWRNYLNVFDDFMRHQYKIIQEGDLEYGSDNTIWLAHRKTILNETGQILKAHFATTQTLSGNMKTKTQEPTIFDANSWDDAEIKGGYSPSAAKSKRKIDRFMRIMLNKAGKGEYADILDFRGYKYGMTLSAIQKQTQKQGVGPQYQAIRDKGERMLGEEFSMATFGDTNVIENTLKEYCTGS